MEEVDDYVKQVLRKHIFSEMKGFLAARLHVQLLLAKIDQVHQFSQRTTHNW